MAAHGEGIRTLLEGAARRNGVRPTSIPAVLDFLRDARFGNGVSCVHCSSGRIQRWGSFSSRRRYRCVACGRTFSDLTGTPAAYIKKLVLWPAFAHCFTEGVSVRRAARRLGIHPSTAFRWRHRWCDGLRRHDDEALGGRIELACEYFVRSHKGSRHLRREPRRRAVPRSLLTRRTAVLVACDRQGDVVTAVLRGPRPDVAELEGELGGRLRGPSTVLDPWGPLGPGSRFAGRRGLDRYDVRRSPGPGIHLWTSWAYGRRLRAWLRRFHGVATKYLPNYLAWHRRVDALERHDPGLVAMRWPIATTQVERDEESGGVGATPPDW